MSAVSGPARLILAATGVMCAWAGELSPPPSEYAARRAALRKSLPGVIVLLGATERSMGELRSGFLQEPNFYYLTGWQEQGAALLMTANEEILFLPDRDERRDRYTGVKSTADSADIHARTGFDSIYRVSALDAEIRKRIDAGGQLHVVRTRAAADNPLLSGGRDAAMAIARLRTRKSAAELRLIERAIAASIEAQRSAWRRIRPGVHEYQIAATMTGSWLERGCERNAYAPIVASGPNSVILHYSRGDRRMDRGEVLLIDAGAECEGYAADLTRTLPVAGKFTARQLELYEIVLAAQQEVIRTVRPGVKLRELTETARKHLNASGRDKRGEPLGKYLTHGVSHHVGLEVHDPYDPDAALEAGMVITIEPGLYIPEESTGIRIEDMVLVTDSGAKVLSAALPSRPHEIERIVRGSR